MPTGIYQHHKASEETKCKIKQTLRGKNFGIENHNFGKHLLEETKRKMSLSHKGKKTHEWSLESRNKLSKTKSGRELSKETRKKLSEINKGKKLSDETKRKLSKFHKGKHTGEKSNFWKGGISNFPYSIDWTRSLKMSIRERDHFSCRLCGRQQGQETRLFSVHHIDYNKLNCNPDNLITLCHSCHAKTNNRRIYWIKYFKN
jgi:hypothetical protein